VDQSPWWFCSDLACRFDLPAPDGTCYVAFDAVTAVRERLGERLARARLISRSEADSVVVSRLLAPLGMALADTCHPGAADFGLTREIATLVPYGRPQQWAGAFHASGIAGIRYEARFAPAVQPNAAALFGVAGLADWPVGAEPAPLSQVAAKAGIAVMGPPRKSALRVVSPPLP
jgi:hypothetical protein